MIAAPGDKYGCEPFKITGIKTSKMVIAVKRGHCNFSLKVYNAQKAGADAVVIANEIASLYENETIPGMYNLIDGCSTDCNAGSSYEPTIGESAIMNGFASSSCSSSSSCDSKKCALMYPKKSTQQNGYHICCVVDKYLDVYVNETVVKEFPSHIPVLFSNLKYSEILWSHLSGNGGTLSAVYIFPRKVNFDMTGVYVWCIGVFTVLAARYKT